MDHEKATTEVREYLELLERANHRRQVLHTAYDTDPTYQAADIEIARRTGLIEKIANEVDPRLCTSLRQNGGGTYAWKHSSRRTATIDLLGQLDHRGRELEILGPQGPSLAADRMHPWVWQPAAKQWDAGNRRDAIQRASTSVFDNELRSKVQRYDLKHLDLVGHVFNVSDPGPKDVRLRLPGYDKGTPEWTDAHEGTRQLGLGCVRAIRNLTTHGLDEPNEPVALEALAALSFFARRVDDAAIERGQPSNDAAPAS